MNTSPYLISGQARRDMKKRLSNLKRFVKMFWHVENVDRVYGGGMDDEMCNIKIELANQQIEIIERWLKLTPDRVNQITPLSFYLL